MKHELKKLFKESKKLTIEEITSSLGGKKRALIQASLKKLEGNGIIYYDDKNLTYQAFPSNFFITEIEEINNGYIFFKLRGEKRRLRYSKDILPGTSIIVKEENNTLSFVKRLPKNTREELFSLDKITNLFFPENSYTYQELKDKFNIPDQELTNYLKELEEEELIFYQEQTDTYIPLAKEYFLSLCTCNKKGTFSITYNNETKELTSREAEGVLPCDKAIFTKTPLGFKLVKIAKRNNNKVVCEITETGTVKVVGRDNFPIKQNRKIAHLNLKPGTRILVSIGNTLSNDGFKIDLIEVLGHKEDIDAELEAIAYNNGFTTRYTDKQLKELDSIPSHVSPEEIKNRLDLRNKNIFTIDSERTKDMDDAIGIEILPNGNYQLTVAIADVTHYIKPGSSLFERALKNTTSLYLIDSVVHMLHPAISNGICSLNENEDRLVKAYIAEITPNGKVVDFQIQNAVIKSKKKMTYTDVNTLIRKNICPAGYEEFQDDLLLMAELSSILTEKRKKQGGLTFDSKEIVFNLNEENDIISISTEKPKEAEKLIENFMVLTNEQVAEYMLNLGISFIYRNHDIPYDDKINETIKTIKNLDYRINAINSCKDPHVLQKILQSLSSKEEFFILSSLLLRSMQRAYFSTENHGHYGLASKAYSQTTSPIRRLMDLIIEYIIDNIENIFADEHTFNELKHKLAELCEHATFMEKCADKAVYEANQLYMINYCLKHPDLVHNAYIAEITPRYIVVKTDALIEGKVMLDDIEGDYQYDVNCKCLKNPNKNRLYIGSKITLSLKDANPEYRELYFYGKPLINELTLTRTNPHCSSNQKQA